MRNRQLVVAWFETSDEKYAPQVQEEVTRLLQKLAEDQLLSNPKVVLRPVLAGMECSAETPETSSQPVASMPMASMPLSCADIFEIEPDTL